MDRGAFFKCLVRTRSGHLTKVLQSVTMVLQSWETGLMSGKVRRAVPMGRRTRHVNARHKPHKVRALPAGLAVHPQRAEPTPVHPYCETRKASGAYWSKRPWRAADGLSTEPCTYKVLDARGEVLGYTDDPVDGLSRAKGIGGTLEVA